MTAMFVASDHNNNEWGPGRIPQEAQMLTLQIAVVKQGCQDFIWYNFLYIWKIWGQEGRWESNKKNEKGHNYYETTNSCSL